MRGLVKVEVIKRLHGKETVKKQSGHNLISTGGLSLMGSRATNCVLMNTAKMAGHRIIRSTMNQLKAYNSSPYTTYNFSRKETALACALLGLSDSVYQNISSLDGFIPVLASTGSVDANKIRAMANLAEDATATEGLAEKRNNDSFIDFNRCGQRYNFPDGTGSGTISGVAMMPGSWRPGAVPFGGFMTMEKLDEVDGIVDGVPGATAIVPPGVDGLGLAVAMKYTTADGIVSHVRNLVTGEVTDGASGDWYPYAGYSIVGDDGTYIFYISNIDNASSPTGYVNSVYRYQKSTGTNTSMQITRYSSDRIYQRITGLYHDTSASKWYFTCSGATSSDGTPRLWYFEDSVGTVSYVEGKSNMASTIASVFGITVPSDWISDGTVQHFCPITVGNYKGLKMARYYNNMRSVEVYLFTDGSDPIGSLVDIIPCLGFDDTLWGIGGNYGVITVGQRVGAGNMVDRSSYLAAGRSTNNVQNADQMLGETGFQASVSNGIHTFNDDYTYGAYIAVKGMWSTWMSLKQLSEDVNKTSTTKMYVEYDYSFESTGTAAVPAFTGTVNTTRDSASASSGGGGQVF